MKVPAAFLTLASAIAFTNAMPAPGTRSSSTRRASSDDRDNGGIHLAVAPNCTTLSTRAEVGDLNAGINLASFKTVVAFGDSYTAGLYDNGTALPPAVLDPPPGIEAGGRATDGPLWIEGVTGDYGLVLMDYAVGGSVTNLSLWPSNPTPNDFIDQMTIFLGQNNTLDPYTTLYSIFFGINDYEASLIDGDHMPEAAQTVLNEITTLSSPPTNARNFLIADDYGRGTWAAQGQAYKQQVFDGLVGMRRNDPTFSFAYVDFQTIWDGVFTDSPGYAAFGYTNTSNCLGPENLISEECSDPAEWFYWIVGHPSKETHRLMADYTEQVLSNCHASR